MPGEKYSPREENLGRNCGFWQGVSEAGRIAVGCCYPKAEMTGRLSCEGIVDDVCLYLKEGRRPQSLTEDQIREIRTRIPGFEENRRLPPGDIV